MDENQENGEYNFNKMLFFILILLGTAPEEEREEFFRRIKEIEQEPDENGGD